MFNVVFCGVCFVVLWFLNLVFMFWVLFGLYIWVWVVLFCFCLLLLDADLYFVGCDRWVYDLRLLIVVYTCFVLVVFGLYFGMWITWVWMLLTGWWWFWVVFWFLGALNRVAYCWFALTVSLLVVTFVEFVCFGYFWWLLFTWFSMVVTHDYLVYTLLMWLWLLEVVGNCWCLFFGCLLIWYFRIFVWFDCSLGCAFWGLVIVFGYLWMCYLTLVLCVLFWLGLVWLFRFEIMFGIDYLI